MTIYRITIVNNSEAGRILFRSAYHTTELGPYKEAKDKGFITDEPIDKDWQIVPDTKILIEDSPKTTSLSDGAVDSINH